jgi:hypothetical protein
LWGDTDKPIIYNAAQILNGIITDSKLVAISDRTKLPSAIAYTDAGNDFATGVNIFYTGANFVLKDPTTPTKQMNFSLSGMTASRLLTIAIVQTLSATLTIPNIAGAGDTVATLALAQTITGVKTYNTYLQL